MESPNIFPKTPLNPKNGKANRILYQCGCIDFREAAIYLKKIPYGPNSTTNDPFILFTENRGGCYTKHSVLAICSQELELPVFKCLCFYGITEKIVTGTNSILEQSSLPFVPTAHCFLKMDCHYGYLTEGNCNGKNIPIANYFTSLQVDPYLSSPEKDKLMEEYIKKDLLPGPLKGFSPELIREAQFNQMP